MRRKGFEFAAAVVVSLAVISGSLACRIPSKPDKSIRVLFIGNSYTYFNNLPRVLEALSASSNVPRKVETKMVAVGGARLSDHWDEGKALRVIREEKWDYVVLQEQSALGGVYLVNGTPRVNRDPEMFYKSARLFHDAIKQAGAKTILFLTWAREDAPASEQAVLNYAYVTIGKELGAIVAPVGVAWQAARKANPKLKLYIDDRSHPLPSGSYLAACVFYSLIYDRNPSGLTSKIAGTPVDHDGSVKTDKSETLIDLSESDAALIQRIAWEIARETKAAGGYPSAPKPSPADDLPKVPDGSKPLNGDLEGNWTGQLNLYPGPPARLELRLSRSGEEWKVAARISFGGKPDDIVPAVSEFKVSDTGISFVDLKGPNGGVVKYQAAFTGNSLSGIAEIIVKNEPIYGIGTLELKRQP